MTRSLLPILWSDCYLSSGHRFRFSNRPHKLLTATTWNHFLTIIGLLAAAAGMICLFSGSFSENQFKDAVKLKVVVFTILPLLVLVFLWKARKCNEVVEEVCHKHVHIKTVVKIVLLGCATMVNLLIKFPRFNVHYSKYQKCSIGEQGKHSQGSRFNLYCAGSFSAFALVISSKGEKAMELGIFDFLLGLTMDASMEIPGNDGVNLLYMLGAFVYCASLIFIRSYLGSFMISRGISGARQGNIPDGSTGRIEGAREDAANETVNSGIYDLATEDYGETIGLLHITMPELMGLNMLGVFVYCASLIFIRSYQESFMLSRDISGAQQENIPDGSTDQIEGAREDAADETVNPVTYDPATEDSGDSDLPDLARNGRDGTSLLTEGAHLGCPQPLKFLYLLSKIFSYPPDLARNGSLLSRLVEIDLKLSEFLHLFGDVVIDGVKPVSELFFEDWQKNRVRTDASEFEIESLSHGLRRRRRSTMSEPHTYHGDVVKGSGILESEIPYEGWRQNGGSVSISESSILESKHGVEQRDEIDGAFVDVGSSEDAYLPDGLRKRRNYRGMKLEIRNVIPGIVRDRFPNLQVFNITGDCY